MENIRYIGHIDKFMSAREGLEELVSTKKLRYVYGDFAIRDILSEACRSNWSVPLLTGSVFIINLVKNLTQSPNYKKIKDTDDLNNFINRDSTVYDDQVKDVEFLNNLMDKMGIQYHLYITQDETGADILTVKKDGGLV